MAILTSCITGLITFFRYIMGENMSNTVLPLLTAFLFLSGIQLFISGLIADILLKSYFETTKDVPYNIENIINCEKE